MPQAFFSPNKTRSSADSTDVDWALFASGDERSRKRSSPPSNYHPATTLEQLSTQSKNNDSHADNVRLVGTADNPIRISLDLDGFRFRSSYFEHVRFLTAAKLERVDFESSTFRNVSFGNGTTLNDANFRKATLSTVDFAPDCLVRGVQFEDARFERHVEIRFDENNITGTRFSFIRKDDWFRLSTAYLGAAQYINLTLSGIYLAILLIKLLLFKMLSVSQGNLLALAHIGSDQLQHRENVTVFNFVFGAHWTAALPAFAILTYQLLRIFLTMRIGPLIEAERASGWTPAYDAYRHYIGLHSISQYLAIVALAAFGRELWNLFDQAPLVLMRTVPFS
jgi:hypothetical protein